MYLCVFINIYDIIHICTKKVIEFKYDVTEGD